MNKGTANTGDGKEKNMNRSRKIQQLAAVLFICSLGASPVWANQAAQIPQIMGRGLLNVISSPLEIIRTPLVESGQHPYAWPLTCLPRTLRNFCYRLTSGIYDIAFYPFGAPFLDKTPPFTEKMGISEYIWQNEDSY